jgi:hypothetical protein
MAAINVWGLVVETLIMRALILEDTMKKKNWSDGYQYQ